MGVLSIPFFVGDHNTASEAYMAMNLDKILGFHGKFIQVCATSRGKIKNDLESMKLKDLVGYSVLYLCARIG
jgi:hypothetical protein